MVQLLSITNLYYRKSDPWYGGTITATSFRRPWESPVVNWDLRGEYQNLQGSQGEGWRRHLSHGTLAMDLLGGPVSRRVLEIKERHESRSNDPTMGDFGWCLEIWTLLKLSSLIQIWWCVRLGRLVAVPCGFLLFQVKRNSSQNSYGGWVWFQNKTVHWPQVHFQGMQRLLYGHHGPGGKMMVEWGDGNGRWGAGQPKDGAKWILTTDFLCSYISGFFPW